MKKRARLRRAQTTARSRQAYLATYRNITYVFCSMECSTNFRSGKPRAEAADDELYGCWQCGQNLAPDIGSIRSSGPASSVYQGRRKARSQ